MAKGVNQDPKLKAALSSLPMREAYQRLSLSVNKIIHLLLKNFPDNYLDEATFVNWDDVLAIRPKDSELHALSDANGIHYGHVLLQGVAHPDETLELIRKTAQEWYEKNRLIFQENEIQVFLDSGVQAPTIVAYLAFSSDKEAGLWGVGLTVGMPLS